MQMRMCEIVQQSKFMEIDFGGIVEILETKNCEYCAILHDKDKREDGTLKEPHYHIYLRFSNGRDSKHIAKWFNVPENCVNKIKGTWKGVLQYAVHENAPEKYQYSVDEVVCNFDYEQSKLTGYGRKEQIMMDIVNGKIREYNIHKELDIIEFDKYKKNIENAFTFRQKILREENSREMECIFITGTSGSGKTYTAKKICEKKGYSYCVSGSSNDPFENYQGQDAIILDDLRGSTFTFADLLKITDNHTSSMVKSRYRNKMLECKLLIITSVMPISTFYQNIFENSNEPLFQFERRMQTYIKMNEDVINYHYFDNNEMSYISYKTVPNPITSLGFNSSTTDYRKGFIDNLIDDIM